MHEILVVLGGDPFVGEPACLPASDRAALGFARLHGRGPLQACIREGDPLAGAYARAAGLEEVPWTDESFREARWILMGRGACGREGDLFAARLAVNNEAALIYDVVDIEPEGAKLRVMRDLGRGNRDELVVSAPAVLVVADSVRRVGYISANRLSRVMEGSREESGPQDMKGWRQAVPRVKLGKHADRVEGTATDRMNRLLGAEEAEVPSQSRLFQGEADACAEHVLRYLKHHHFLDSAGDEKGEGPSPDWDPSTAPLFDPIRPASPNRRTPSSAASGSILTPALMRAPRRRDGSRPGIRGPFKRSEEHSK